MIGLTPQQLHDYADYGVYVGADVEHIRDSTWTGVVISIDRNLKDISTCRVRWTDEANAGEVSVQWTNKLTLREKVDTQ